MTLLQTDINAPKVRVKYQIHDEMVAAISAVSKSDRVDAFEICSAWLMDTGCGHDMIGSKTAQNYTDHMKSTYPMNFNTANGDTKTDKVLPIRVSALENSLRFA